MALSAKEIEYWRQWIGRGAARTDIIDHATVRRYAAAIGEEWQDGESLPSMALGAFFLDAPQPGELGPDGHPKRGGFMPPVTLPRRVAGASDTTFYREVEVGMLATRTSAITDVIHKTGRSGDLVLVETKTDIEQAGELCSTTKYTSIYLGEADPAASAGARAETVEPPPAPAPGDETWEPSPVDLFRFSAVTFNSHRIHYDLPYATGVEGYPGLLVQGPFTAAKLFGLARRTHGRLSRFSFRALAPIFAGQPIRLGRGENDRQVIARRSDGKVAMTADFDVWSS